VVPCGAVQQRHRITGIDPDALTGQCLKCGPVNLIRRPNNRNPQRPYFKCELAEVARRSNPSSKHPNWRSRDKYPDGRPGKHKLTREQARKRIRNKRCEICAAPAEINDHCHKNEFLRGVLCHRCNRLLGIIEAAEPGLLDALVDYVNRYSGLFGNL
jgi:hypothetical protein